MFERQPQTEDDYRPLEHRFGGERQARAQALDGGKGRGHNDAGDYGEHGRPDHRDQAAEHSGHCRDRRGRRRTRHRGHKPSAPGPAHVLGRRDRRRASDSRRAETRLIDKGHISQLG